MLLQKKSIFNLIGLHIENELSTVKECQSRIFLMRVRILINQIFMNYLFLRCSFCIMNQRFKCGGTPITHKTWNSHRIQTRFRVIYPKPSDSIYKKGTKGFTGVCCKKLRSVLGSRERRIERGYSLISAKLVSARRSMRDNLVG